LPNLSGADEAASILVGVIYRVNNLKCVHADFKDAIADDERLSVQLRAGKAKNAPPVVKSKKELREELHNCEQSSSIIEHILSISRLPDYITKMIVSLCQS